MIVSLPWWERVRERGKFTLTQILLFSRERVHMKSESAESSPCHAEQSSSERVNKLRLDF
jgi:hypothetical protein